LPRNSLDAQIGIFDGDLDRRNTTQTDRRLFGGELLDPIGVPGIWFPFGIGVSRTQYVYAIAIPLLAFLIVRTLLFKENASIERRRSVVPVAT
jgi:hypothetical protein